MPYIIFLACFPISLFILFVFFAINKDPTKNPEIIRTLLQIHLCIFIIGSFFIVATMMKNDYILQYTPEHQMEYEVYENLKEIYQKNPNDFYKELNDRSFRITIQSKKGKEYIIKNLNKELSIENNTIGNVPITKRNFKRTLERYKIDPILLYSKAIME